MSGVMPVSSPTKYPTKYTRALEEDEYCLAAPVLTGPSWWSPDGIGAYYYISADYGRSLYYSGTLCNANYGRRGLKGKPAPDAKAGEGAGEGQGEGGGEEDEEGTCPIYKLENGITYTYRVTGNYFKYKDLVSWSFCGVKGVAQQQLTFKVVCDDRRRSLLPVPGAGKPGPGAGAGGPGVGKPGAGGGGGGGGADCDCQCVPIAVTNSSKECVVTHQYMHTVTSILTLGVKVNLGGFSNEDMSTEEHSVLKAAIAQEFSSNSVGSTDVSIAGWEVLDSGVKDARALSGRMGMLSFRVKVATDGEHELVAASAKKYLQKSMSSGLFISKLVMSAREKGLDSLQAVNFAEFVDLMVVHESRINEEVSSVASLVVTVGALMGILFGVVFYRSFKKSPTVSYSSVESSDNAMDGITMTSVGTIPESLEM